MTSSISGSIAACRATAGSGARGRGGVPCAILHFRARFAAQNAFDLVGPVRLAQRPVDLVLDHPPPGLVFGDAVHVEVAAELQRERLPVQRDRAAIFDQRGGGGLVAADPVDDFLPGLLQPRQFLRRGAVIGDRAGRGVAVGGGRRRRRGDLLDEQQIVGLLMLLGGRDDLADGRFLVLVVHHVQVGIARQRHVQPVFVVQ